MSDLRVSLAQGETRWHDPDGNRAYYGQMIAGLRGKTDVIVLPETFTSGFSNDALGSAETMQGITIDWMREQARGADSVVCGSIQLRDGDKVFNRMLWVQPDGQVQHYDKRHLFRMANEHKVYSAGKEKLVVEWRGWRICPMVCYDLRFPVYSRNRFSHLLKDQLDYDLLIFVANWPSPRRNAWRTLLRARAMENVACVVGVNRVGTDGNGLQYAGDSAALDWLGDAIVDCGTQEQLVHASFSRSGLDAFREKFPAHQDADAFEIL